MSDVDEYGDEGQEKPKGNTLREQNSKLAERNKALEEQLTKLLSKDRSRTVADVLRDKGANPKLAKYAERDLPDGDVDASAVEKWLAEEGELFGYKPGGQEADQDAEDDTDDAVAEQQQRISSATASAPAMPTGWTPEKLRQSTPQQLIAAGLLDPKR